jgi:hypothetical protein
VSQASVDVARGFVHAHPDSDRTKALRAMTRARGLVRTRIGLANQLRDQRACF